jgi:predicted XRE-type DNA-binding protein
MSETRELILTLRRRRLSQTRIAELTGIPQPRLSRWENGEVPDAADDALKLAALVAAGTEGPPEASVAAKAA